MAEYSHLSETDPEIAPVLVQLQASPPLPMDDLDERRKQFNGYTELINKTHAPRLPQDTEYQVSDHQVDVANGKIRVRSLIPTPKESTEAVFPLMAWIHGGGWTDGNIELDDYSLRKICVELQISIVNIEYRLAPEYPHPTGLNDCYSALKWAVESRSLLSADLKKGFIVAGASAGGHLAAVIAHRTRDDAFFKDRQLTGQLLQIPAVVHPDAVPEKYKASLLSFEQNKFAPILTAETARWCYKQLGGNPEDPEISPLLYPSHANLPPAVIMVCGLDVLRDEAFLYERVLRNAGVKTKISVYPGVPHGFHSFLPSYKLTLKWEEDYREGLRWILKGAPQ
ncbi:Alpha/Beta hydrolase protein [Mycena galericulata]|nr:Alpha/Beta hydrolase protein [Mycena galericulata]